MIAAHIPKVVFEYESSMLVRCLSNDEIKKVVFALNSDSAPGHDGFGGSFFHGCWDIVGSDDCNVVKQFFSHNWILPEMNANVVGTLNIALISLRKPSTCFLGKYLVVKWLSRLIFPKLLILSVGIFSFRY